MRTALRIDLRSQALFARLLEWAAGEEALGLEHSGSRRGWSRTVVS